jgi:AraC-like DNA-binding protein
MPSQAMERRSRVWRAIERCATDPTIRIIALSKLSRSTGVSVRTLNNVRNAVSGQPAKAYIRRRPMALALDMLHRARPSNCTATQVATFCGFDHFGRSSEAFRNHHGELPSSVIRRLARAA